MVRVLVPPHACLGCPLDMSVVLENRGVTSIEFGNPSLPFMSFSLFSARSLSLSVYLLKTRCAMHGVTNRDTLLPGLFLGCRV